MNWLPAPLKFVLATLVVGIVLWDILIHHKYMEPDDDQPSCGPVLEADIRKIVRQEVNRKCVRRLAGACSSGFLRGCLLGLLSGNFDTALNSGLANGILNPLLVYYSR
jgi:hypothetical protein